MYIIYVHTYEFQFQTGDDGLIKVTKFMDFLLKTRRYPDVQLETMETVTEACKNHKHLSENKYELNNRVTEMNRKI